MSYLPVILVPGFRDNERKVTYLARRLRTAGFVSYPVSPQPSTGEVGLEYLAAQLPAAVEEILGTEARFHLFGFSMGGLITRYYVQMLGGAARVEQLVTFATPNWGSWLAYLYPDLHACRQMIPGSAFLNELNRNLAPLEQIHYTSIWSRLDLTILPAGSSRLPVGKMLTVNYPVHGWLLRDPRLVRVVVEQFLAAEARRLHAARRNPE